MHVVSRDLTVHGDGHLVDQEKVQLTDVLVSESASVIFSLTASVFGTSLACISSCLENPLYFCKIRLVHVENLPTEFLEWIRFLATTTFISPALPTPSIFPSHKFFFEWHKALCFNPFVTTSIASTNRNDPG